MRVVTYIHDSRDTPAHVRAVLEHIGTREETPEVRDIDAAEDRADALRDAMLETRSAVRVGENPDGIYDDEGNPDFSAGVLITQQPTGRRELHVGREALEALESA